VIEDWEQYRDLEYYPWPKVHCHCFCYGKIKVRPSHKYGGIPVYIHNHHGKGIVSSKKGKTYEEMYGEEKAGRIKQKIGIFGENNPAKRPEVREKISNSNRGRLPWTTGLTKETDSRVAKSAEKRRGRTKETYSGVASQAAKLGGAKKTPGHNKKNSEGKKRYYQEHPGVVAGKNNPNWQGGISDDSYPDEFNEEFKILIRERYNYTCMVCKQTQEQVGYTLRVHHIDYDKDNLDPDNFVPLCLSCHGATGGKKNRNYWTGVLQNMVRVYKFTEVQLS